MVILNKLMIVKSTIYNGVHIPISCFSIFVAQNYRTLVSHVNKGPQPCTLPKYGPPTPSRSRERTKSVAAHGTHPALVWWCAGWSVTHGEIKCHRTSNYAQNNHSPYPHLPIFILANGKWQMQMPICHSHCALPAATTTQGHS